MTSIKTLAVQPLRFDATNEIKAVSLLFEHGELSVSKFGEIYDVLKFNLKAGNKFKVQMLINKQKTIVPGVLNATNNHVSINVVKIITLTNKILYGYQVL